MKNSFNQRPLMMVLAMAFISSSFLSAQGSNFETLEDPRDGKVYKTVVIGNQVWMAENLAHQPSSGFYSVYEREPSNVDKYGYLYPWETANNVCPAGWHLPTDAEWTTLIDFLGGAEAAGEKMKSEAGWPEEGNGTNSSGFSALPGGLGWSDGDFAGIGKEGYWWSSTESDEYSAIYLGLANFNGTATKETTSKWDAFSVRCIKD